VSAEFPTGIKEVVAMFVVPPRRDVFCKLNRPNPWTRCADTPPTTTYASTPGAARSPQPGFIPLALITAVAAGVVR
jgi:hypothetical protein